MKGTRPWMLLWIASIIIFALSFCAPGDDERALRELVENAARLAEEHDIGGIMDLTTQDFKARPGDLDRRKSKGILFMTFRHYGELKVIHPRPKVVLEPEEGGPAVSFPFLILKKNQSLPGLEGLYEDPEGWIRKAGEKADLYRFKLKAVKADGEWLVREAWLQRWTGLGFRE